MTKKKKNLRICTIKDYPDCLSKEWIEIDDNGFMYWKADDYSELFSSEVLSSIKDTQIIDSSFVVELMSSIKDKQIISSSFVVDIDFVKEFFHRANRTLDVDKLPSNTKFDPYSMYIG